ncbi:MAG: hypothetical protein ACREQA_17270, partial [Candidatus Binatia bacterium]
AVLWSTGLVVLWYTVETHGLRLEMVRQNEMAIQPLVVATIEEKWEQRTAPTARDCVVLKNIGRGTALYIQPAEIEFEKVSGGRFVARFERIDYLEPGKDAVSEVNWRGEFQEGASEPIDFVSNLKPYLATRTYDVRISYEDINGQKRESIVRMGKGGIRLLDHGKVKS